MKKSKQTSAEQQDAIKRSLNPVKSLHKIQELDAASPRNSRIISGRLSKRFEPVFKERI